jgi:large subunit ribosomal protein L10
MPLTREQKQEIVNNLEEKINRQKAMVFTASEGLKAEEIFELRRKLKEKDCLLSVVKKTLADRIFKKNEINCDAKEMAGQLALIFGFKDQISPAKISYKFSQTNKKLKILGGFFENNFINTEKVVELAKIPSKEELLAQFVRSIKAPVANFVNVLQGNIKGLLYILTKIKT